jgi:hypothetical protein
MPFVIPLLVRYLSVNIAMANIYLLSYLGGACGEWLSYQIGKDVNYYDVRIGEAFDTNKFVIVDPLAEWNFTIKSPYDQESLKVPPDVVAKLTEKYSEKNFIIPTHYLGPLRHVNLPTLKGVRLTFTHRTSPLFYSLLWIKTWIESRPLDNNTRDLLMKCAKGNSGDPALLKESEVMDIAERILARGHYYAFELSALRAGIRDSTTWIQRFYGFYFRYNIKPLPDYRTVSLEELMFNPANTVNDWQDAFNMVEPISVSEIEQYHATNIKVIENTFNMSYNNWREDKWISLLTEWVKFKCPDMY